MLDETALGQLLDLAERSLFRLEVLDAYDVASDGGDFSRYLRGDAAPDPARKEPWLARLRDDARRGLRNYRVHVVRSPLSPYLRYEFEWGYAYNVQAGEDIRILDVSEVSPPPLISEDFWLVDDREVVRMHYDLEGRFFGAEILASREVSRYRAARDAAWQAAEPFSSYWSAHPQFRRRAA